MITNNSIVNELSDVSIALWGPHGAGKTWLVKSLAKSLEKHNGEASELRYGIRNANTGEDLYYEGIPEVFPTVGMVGEEWIFGRKVNTRFVKKVSYKHKISVYEHRIEIRDVEGELTEKLKEHEDIQKYIRGAKSVLLILDPFQFGDRPPESSPMPNRDDDVGNTESNVSHIKAEKTIFTEEDYCRLVRDLIKLLSNSNNTKNLAICVTKYDRLGIRTRDPWEVIDIKFGTQMLELFRATIKDPSKNLNIRPFLVSSFGYLDKAQTQPNFNQNSGFIQKKDAWEPFNVEAPFFWLFEQTERQILNQASQNIFQKLFERDRIQSYIPYPKTWS
ncbi:hypothetical protein HY990_01995 [Candidatus Micrarchaeota archaeon]|nr:hypothetical protein [Candidatus Micrarchaeota archaeon]